MNSFLPLRKAYVRCAATAVLLVPIAALGEV